MFRRLYDRLLELSGSRRALPILTALSFAESSFFPIPPDVMLIPMCVANRARAFVYAFWCSLGSILGGALGYAIGMFFWDALGPWLFELLPTWEAKFDQVSALYDQYNFWIVFTAGFTPIPYKIITLAGGVAHVNFPMFMLASALSRSARFYLEAWLVHRYGEPAQKWIEERFNLVVSLVMLVIIIAVVVWTLLH